MSIAAVANWLHDSVVNVFINCMLWCGLLLTHTDLLCLVSQLLLTLFCLASCHQLTGWCSTTCRPRCSQACMLYAQGCCTVSQAEPLLCRPKSMDIPIQQQSEDEAPWYRAPAGILAITVRLSCQLVHVQAGTADIGPCGLHDHLMQAQLLLLDSTAGHSTLQAPGGMV